MPVTSIHAPYRLTFMLPGVLAGLVAPGIHQPCVAGCLLMIDRTGLVAIEGRTRGLVFDQARRLFRVAARDRPAMIISAALVTPQRRRESWEIAINSDVTFSRDIAPVISTEIENIGNPREGSHG